MSEARRRHLLSTALFRAKHHGPIRRLDTSRQQDRFCPHFALGVVQPKVMNDKVSEPRAKESLLT